MSLSALSLALLATSASAFSIRSSLTARAKDISSGCSTSGSLSCSSSSASGTCCLEGKETGLLLQTQFWDAGSSSDSTGPTNSWTIHGLWPDACDGTFEENCDSSRDYTDISTLLTDQGASDTLSFMQTYWKNLPSDGSDEELWEHEWATHGTCYSTLQTSCLPSGSPKGAEAVAFYQTVVKLFQTLPTYEWLSDAGIVPSSSKTYTLSALNSAVESAWGFEPAFQCSGSTLDGVEYYFNLRGSVIDGEFVARTAATSSTCPSSGIKYTPKTGTKSVSTTTTKTKTTSTKTTSTKTTTSTGSSGTSTAVPSRASLVASSTGGILSAGTWSTQTLATMTLSGNSNGFTMTSSKGDCGVSSSGEFSCGSGVSSTTFTAVTSGGELLLATEDGETEWSSSATPSGSTVETVFSGSGKSKTYTLTIEEA
ncbi:RNase Gf29 [Mycena chlorophos]|uniref:Ribonuclease T2-like n=1 Tax=Mycena chlorophos TaxID=658473 RepID=A0A8H6SU38_MYCCL|nr:RNase Gf29 [Mycena chlorophos]